MKCMSVACHTSLPEDVQVADVSDGSGAGKLRGSCAMHMRLNMIASTQDSCIPTLEFKDVKGLFSVQDSSMEAAAMRKRLPRAFLQESMRV